MSDTLSRSYKDLSGTIAVTNTPQLVSPSKPRLKLVAMNVGANNMGFVAQANKNTPSQTGSADAGCITLVSLGSWFDSGPASSDAIWVIGTEGDAYTFKEMPVNQ